MIATKSPNPEYFYVIDFPEISEDNINYPCDYFPAYTTKLLDIDQAIQALMAFRKSGADAILIVNPLCKCGGNAIDFLDPNTMPYWFAEDHFRYLLTEFLEGTDSFTFSAIGSPLICCSYNEDISIRKFER